MVDVDVSSVEPLSQGIGGIYLDVTVPAVKGKRSRRETSCNTCYIPDAT